MVGHAGCTRKADGLLLSVRVLLVMVMALVLCAALGGCKVSDRLTEVVYDQDSDNIDYDNPSKVLVQDPEAEETTDELPRVEQADEEKNDESEQDPAEDDESEDDEETSEADVTQTESTTYTTVTGGTQAAGTGGTGSLGEGEESGSVADDGDTKDDTSGGANSGRGEGDDESGDEIGGTGGARGGGTQTYYATVGSYQDVPTGIDYVAACGEAATIVSMLAGNADALLYTDAQWASRDNIEKVLGSKYNDELVVAWSEDGDGYDLSDAMLATMIADEKLEAVCVVSGQKTLTSDQQEQLEDAGITIITLPDMTTATNICESVEWMGRVFEAGHNTNTYAGKLADAYVEFHDSILETCSDVASTKTNDNDGEPVSSSDTQLYTLFVTDWADNVTYEGTKVDLTMKYGIGITEVGYEWAPVDYYLSVGGAYNTASSPKNSYLSGTTFVWQFNTNHVGMTESDFSRQGLVDNYFKNTANTAYGWTYLCSSDFKGVGTSYFPYVITSNQADTEKMLADKELGESSDDVNTLYELYGLSVASNSGISVSYYGPPGTSNNMCFAVGGLTGEQKSSMTVSETKSLHENGDYDVVTNPEGLFGESWVYGSVESVLETAWISALYYPDSYAEDFVEDTVSNFYSTFYGYDLSSKQLTTILAGPEDD